MSFQDDLSAMSFDGLLDERVNLRIRINLMENDESSSSLPVEPFRELLAQLEQFIAERRRLGTA